MKVVELFQGISEGYGACTDPDARPVISVPTLRVFVGLDGSYAHDGTALATVTVDTRLQKVRLVAHKIFTTSPDVPLNFEDVAFGPRRPPGPKNLRAQLTLTCHATPEKGFAQYSLGAGLP